MHSFATSLYRAFARLQIMARKAVAPAACERYANHILWMGVWRIILTVGDSTRKKVWLDALVAVAAVDCVAVSGCFLGAGLRVSDEEDSW
jgi:hypothetical protein